MSPCILWLVAAATAAEIPLPIIPQGVGVNIHFAGPGNERDLDLIAAAGFRFVRMDFTWGRIEKKKCEYDWQPYDVLTDELDKRGIRALYILDYSNALYEEAIVSKDPQTGKERKDVAAPQRPESVAAFARWAGKAAKRYRGRHILWEIWNEPNIGFWKPKPDVNQYIPLALATCKAIREADPKATIIAPASSGFPWDFLEAMFKAGLLSSLDAVSVHPYRGSAPETAAADYARLRALIAQYAPRGKENMPILSGEWGYPTHTKGVSLDLQAAYIARQHIHNLLCGVPLSIWYDWRNDGTDANYNEHNFGAVTHDRQPKPSYLSVQRLTTELAGFRVAKRLPTDDLNDFVLLCVNAAGEQKLAAWTLNAGNPHSMKVEGIELALDVSPSYVALPIRSETLALHAAWGAQAATLWVEAGEKDTARVTATATNPLGRPLEFSASVEGLEGRWTPSKSVKLKPGRSTELEWRGTIIRRDAASVELTVTSAFGGRLKVTLFLKNPLHLRRAPTERGVRLTVSNPSGGQFHGTVALDGGEKQPVRLERGQKEAQVELARVASVRLLDDRERLAAELPPARFVPLDIPSYRAALDGDAKVPAKAGIELADAPGPDAPFARAWKLDYDFDPGWRFVRLVPDVKTAIAIEGQPRSLGVWVFSDESKNSPRMRFVDSQGQTFQPTSDSLTWKGWRWVEFRISDPKGAGHWGGPNDGIIRWPVRLDCPLLVDGHKQKTSGTVYFAGATWVY